MKTNKSIWLDDSYPNVVLTEIYDAEHPFPGEENKPMKVFEWIYKNNAKKILFSSLSEFAPLFPVVSYQGEASAYLSPPPSGSGNAIYIIIGKDQTGKIRAVGGNYFNSTDRGNYSSKDFWKDYDSRKDDQSKFGLISGVIGFHTKNYPTKDIDETERISEYVRTMPIYLLTLDGQIGHMAIFPAIVCGKYPCDFSYEKLGEVSL